MLNVDNYIDTLTALLKSKFGTRLLYVGLQGSYLRGEATADSDIDIMVVIDGLSVSDLAAYRQTIQSLPHFDKSCGFICSKSDLMCWNPLEIFGLVHGTKDYYGNLRELVPKYSRQDIRNFVKMSLNNLYHEICHRYIHSTTESYTASLTGSYKSVFFILQNIYYLSCGEYVATKFELLSLLHGKNRAVLKRSLDLHDGIEFDFHDSFELLFSWCQETLQSVN